MPKHFQTKEKLKIHHCLIEEGKKSWKRYGIKHSNVEEICNAVGISKGSFYSFFDSKELLFMEIFETSEQQVKKILMEVALNHKGSSKERFMSALSKVFEEVRENPWLSSLMGNKGEYEYLIRKLPGERVEKHNDGDDEDTQKFMSLLVSDIKDVDIKTVSAAIKGIFFILMHEEEIGKENIESVFNMLLEGLAERLFGRDLDDRSK
jgi:AcrR family transcriptional regulator